VRVNEAAYGKSHTFTANVTYNSSYGIFSGTFLAKSDTTISIPSLPSTPTQQLFDILLLVLIAALIGSLVTLAAVLHRRR
jgi:cytosine/uracil/thiamine/allantoin permease